MQKKVKSLIILLYRSPFHGLVWTLFVDQAVYNVIVLVPWVRNFSGYKCDLNCVYFNM